MTARKPHISIHLRHLLEYTVFFSISKMLHAAQYVEI
jgi:hypothetical protein